MEPSVAKKLVKQVELSTELIRYLRIRGRGRHCKFQFGISGQMLKLGWRHRTKFNYVLVAEGGTPHQFGT